LPRLTFQLSPAGLAITLGAAVVATMLAMAASSSTSPTSSEEAAYRDD
jgi:hypothetical protein